MKPEEIRSVTFEKGMRGYRCEDVDEFLQQVAEAMEEEDRKRRAAQAEAAENKKKLMVLAQRIEDYRADEDTLKTALINAQRMGDNVIREAKQKADVILREANVQAEDITHEAKSEASMLDGELERLRTEVARFKSEVLGLYKQHIELLSMMPGKEPETVPLAESLPDPEPDAEPAAAAQKEPAASTAPPPEIPIPSWLEDPAPEETAQASFADAAPAAFDVAALAQQLSSETPAAQAAPAAPAAGSDAEAFSAEVPLPPVEEPTKTDLPGAFDSFRGISFDD